MRRLLVVSLGLLRRGAPVVIRSVLWPLYQQSLLLHQADVGLNKAAPGTGLPAHIPWAHPPGSILCPAWSILSAPTHTFLFYVRLLLSNLKFPPKKG